MPGLGMELEVFGEQVISRRLLRFADNVQDARPAFHRITAILERAELRRFESEGAYGGEKWAPLADSTVARKGTGKGILVDSGALRASLTQETAAGALREIGPQQLRWGSTVAYGRFHQTGTSRMPQRRPVQLTEQVKVQIMRELQQHAVGERGAAK